MRPPELRIHHDELIVDNFAGGGGASLGIETALGRSPDIAVNHDPEAVAMHAENHPTTRHLCGDVWDVNPREVCGGRRVGLAWFSPDCTHHSKAKGGKPRDKKGAEKSRALAWVVVRWAKAVKPRIIMLENVEEFANWGPLGEDGRPDKLRKGHTFRRWLGQLEAAGYIVEMRELRAHDYGAPTIRKRLFVIARSDGQPIVWPVPTHGPGRAQPHRVAAECIQWEHACPSIFERAKPLADKTLRRIARGVMRYVVGAAKPFIVPATHGDGASGPDRRIHSVDEPLRTIITRGAPFHLVTPFVAPTTHAGDLRVHSLEEPMRTVTCAKRGEFALFAPTLVQTGYGEREGQAPRALDLQQPLGTIVAGGCKHALVAAYLAKHNGGGNGQGSTGSQVDLPMHTITTQDHHSLVTSHMIKLRGTCADGQPIDAPAPTITAGGMHLGEVRAFLTKYYGTGEGQSAQLPLGTVTTRDRFGLVYVHGEPHAIADIGMRMLQPRELFRAQGFHDGYKITPVVDGKPLSKTAQIRMCGNSVCPPMAAALVRANVLGAAAEVA